MKQSWVKSTSVPEESEIQITNNQATISSEAFEDNSEHINIPVIETSEGEVVKDIEVELPKVDEQGQASVISFDEVAEGATVTIKEDADATEEHSIEELTVILPSGDAQVEIDMPNTTVTIVSSDGEELVIEEVIVGTADETFIVKENVYIKKLTVKCGNVEVYGRVGEIKRHADYKTDGSPATIYVYEIDNGEVGSIGEGVSFASNMNGVVTSEAQLVSALNIQAGDRAEITLGDNITLTKAVNVPEGTYVTLNLNGKSIANTNDYIFENKANLTIDGEGTLEGMGIIRSTTGKVTINNGNYYASSQWQNGVYQHTLKAENSEVEINGGNFDATMKGQTNAMFNASTGATITINAGNFKNVNGTLSNFDPYLFTYENDGKVIINLKSAALFPSVNNSKNLSDFLQF